MIKLYRTNEKGECISALTLKDLLLLAGPISSKEEIAQDLYYLFGNDEIKYTEVLEKYKIAKFDVIAITKLVFDLSKQLSAMVVIENS